MPKYLSNCDRLQAGLPMLGAIVTPADTCLTMRELVIQFLNSKRRLMENSERLRQTQHDYYVNCGHRHELDNQHFGHRNAEAAAAVLRNRKADVRKTECETRRKATKFSLVVG